MDVPHWGNYLSEVITSLRYDLPMRKQAEIFLNFFKKNWGNYLAGVRSANREISRNFLNF